MRLSLFKLRRMIMEELDRGGRLHEGDSNTVTVEQFMDAVAQRMMQDLGQKNLSPQAVGKIDDRSSELPRNVSGVRIRRGRYNGPLAGDDTACLIVGGSSGTYVVPDAFKDQFALDAAARRAFNDVKAMYAGVTITSQGGDYLADEAEIYKPKKVIYTHIKYDGGEDSQPPVMDYSDEYQVYVIPTSLDNRLLGM